MNTISQGPSVSDREAIKRVIHDNQRFLITTHVQADPDALGSEIALAEALRSVGKEPIVVNPTPVSRNYCFIDTRKEIVAYDGNFDCHSFDAVFILDISRWERLGGLADPIRDCDRPKVCMDHHPYSGGHADLHIVDTKACASAEIVYDLIKDLGIPLTRKIAEALYVAIIADTGSFSFSNTSTRSHEIACDLLAQGIGIETIHEQLHQNHSPERLVFLGKALSTLKFDCSNRLAWITIPHRMLAENGIHPDEIDGFVDMARNCRNVLLSVLLLEVEPNDIKISLRAKGNFNANRLAAKFGGGGHAHASGIRLTGSLTEIETAVLAEAREAVCNCE